jgi:SAM-dependent methyltransferase
VLDLACGHGRHARHLAAAGWRVVAVDRDPDALASLAGIANVTPLEADLEGADWPLASARFDGIVVCNYLHRALFPLLVEALADDGVLLYETFAVGNARFGKPSRPDFLLEPGELLRALGAELVVVAFEQGEVRNPAPAVVQRLCAVGRGRPWPPGPIA